MTKRERVRRALQGERVDQVPLTAYEWMWEDWGEIDHLARRGLTPTRHVATCRRMQPDVRFEEETFQKEGRQWQRQFMRTPVGMLEKLSLEGWTQEYWVKEPADYEVVEWMVGHTQLEENYAAFLGEQEAMGDDGIVIVSAHRSPIQELMVDLVGLQNFCYHLADDVEELYSCHEAMMERTGRELEIIAEGPGEFVKLWENFTAETFGADRFQQFHIPVYRRAAALFEPKGKRLMAHMDGEMARVRHLLSDSGLDILESLTPPSEGDVPPEQWRQLWPDMVFWANVPLSWYGEAPEAFADCLRHFLQAVGDTRGLLLEISEDLPRNWPESVPVVLEVLEEWEG
jgi:hypothetical protein